MSHKSLKKLKYTLVLLFPFFLTLGWNFFDFYDVGGDDSRLFFVFPDHWYTNVSSSFVNTAYGNYIPQLPSLGFVWVLKYLHVIFNFLGLNVQFTTYQLLLVGGYLFTFLFLRELLSFIFENSFDSDDIDLASFLGAMLYTFIPIQIYTTWNNVLASSIGVVSYPLLAFVSVSVLKKPSFSKVFLGNILLLPFALSFVQVPFFLGFLLILLVLLFGLFLTFDKKVFFKRILYLLCFIGFFLLFNLYWILPWIDSLASANFSVASALSSSGKNVAITTVEHVSDNLFPLDTILGVLSPELIASWDLNFVRYHSFSKYLLIVFPLATFFGFFVSLRQKAFDRKKLIWVYLTFFLSFYLVTVNVPLGGVSFFSFLTANVPGWVMFRNYFGKFALAYAFLYSSALAVSFLLISKVFHGAYPTKMYLSLKKYLVLILVVGTLINAFPLFSGHSFKSNKLIPAESSGKVLPNYLTEIADTLRGKSSRVLFFPLTRASWSYIPAQDTSSYVGLSPFYALSDIQSIDGKFSFRKAGRFIPGFEDQLLDTLQNNDYEMFKKMLFLLRVENIVINKDALTAYDTEAFKDVVLYPRLSGQLSKSKEPSFILEGLYNDPEFVVEKDTKDYTIFKVPVSKIFTPDRVIYLENNDFLGVLSTDVFTSNSVMLSAEQMPDTQFYTNQTKVKKDYNSVITHAAVSLTEPLYIDSDSLYAPEYFEGIKVTDPASIVYKFVRLRENITLKFARSKEQKLDTRLWHLNKRAKEYVLYGKQESLDEVKKELFLITNLIKNVSPSKTNSYLKTVVTTVLSLQQNFAGFSSLEIPYPYNNPAESKCLIGRGNDLCVEYTKLQDYDYLYILPANPDPVFKTLALTDIGSSGQQQVSNPPQTSTQQQDPDKAPVATSYGTRIPIGSNLSGNSFSLKFVDAAEYTLADFNTSLFESTTTGFISRDVGSQVSGQVFGIRELKLLRPGDTYEFTFKGHLEAGDMGIAIIEEIPDSKGEISYKKISGHKFNKVGKPITYSDTFTLSANATSAFAVLYHKSPYSAGDISLLSLREPVKILLVKEVNSTGANPRPANNFYNTDFVSPHEIKFNLKNESMTSSTPELVVFSNLYNKRWKFEGIEPKTHLRVNGLFNGWLLNLKDNQGFSGDVTIYLSPARYTKVLFEVSILFILFGSLVFVVIEYMHFKQKKRSVSND